MSSDPDVTIRARPPWTSVIAERHRPLWSVPHPVDSRCACWIRGAATHGEVTTDLRHPLAWAAGVLVRFHDAMAAGEDPTTTDRRPQ
jgi:hypothetical protein